MSKKISEMPEALSLEDTDIVTGLDNSQPVADQNVKIQKSNLGFAADDDPRLSDNRDPNAHASTHFTAGDDRIEPSDIGAEPAFAKNNAFNKSFGTGNDDVARGDAPGAVQTNLDNHIGTGAATAHADAATLTDLNAHKAAVDGLQHPIAGITGLQAELDDKVPDDRQVIAGAGISGGGTLDNDVTLSLPNTNAQGVYANADITVDNQGRIIAAADGTPGASNFTDLGDTPSDYVGQAGQRLAVNSTPNGVEFIDPDTFLDLPDTPAAYTGQGGKNVSVNSGATGLEFTDPPSGGSAHVIRDETQAYPQQPNLKFVGAGVSVGDLPGESATEVTITSGTDRHVIQEDTIPQPDRPNLNFVGLLVTASDNAGANATDVTVNPIQLLDDEEDPVPARPILRFSGGGVTITDNAVDQRTEVNIPADKHQIRDDGASLADRANLDFKGDLVRAVDDPGSNSTFVFVDPRPVLNGDTPVGAQTTLSFAGGLQAVENAPQNRIDLSLDDTGVVQGTYNNATVEVDTNGRITSASNGVGGHAIKDEDDANLIQRPVLNFRGNIVQATDNVTNNRTEVAINGVPESRQIIGGTGIDVSPGGDLSQNQTINLANIGGVEGSYTNTNLTIDAQGRITAAANGSGGGGAGTFLDLDDTPSAYTGQASNIPVVNSVPDGLEFEVRQSAFNKDFGSVADTVCEGNDIRLSDARAPTPHASTHGSGQSDPLAPSDINAVEESSENETTGSLKMAVVAALPGTPDADTVYFVTT